MYYSLLYLLLLSETFVRANDLPEFLPLRRTISNKKLN